MNLKNQLLIKDPINPLSDFERIADMILNSSVLNVNESKFRICSIEFYYQHLEHQDKAAHQHKRQLTSGEWYFHGSGLDITFGNDKEYGGILIQAIKKLDESRKLIVGPLNVVTTLFEKFGNVNLKTNSFGLEEYEHKGEEIFSAPRVGLNKDTVGKDFSKGYRFLIFPQEAHKNKIDIINHLVSTSKMSEEEAKDKIYKQ